MSRKGFGGPRPTPPMRGEASGRDVGNEAAGIDDALEADELAGDVARDPARRTGEQDSA